MENYFTRDTIKRILKDREVRKTILLLACAVVLLIAFWFVGLFKQPRHYKTVRPSTDNHISQYLSNYIVPQIHNKSQYDQPFDLVISEAGVNDIIAAQIDANSLKRSNISDLSVTFKPGKIYLTGKTTYAGFDFVITMILKPYIDSQGRLFINASKIQAGKSRIPFAAEAVKRKILYELAGISGDADTAAVFASLLASDGIKPEFSINHRKLCVDEIAVRDQNLLLHFNPQ